MDRKEATRAFLDKLTPGAILADSWGYEQTNVDFYKVLSKKGSMVTIQEVGHINEEATSWASCYVTPDISQPIGEPLQKRVSSSRIKVNSSVSLTIWNGRPLYKSWYY